MNVLAQTDTTKHFSWKSFFGKNLNPGISMGVGGARPYGFMPQPTIKLGRFEFEMSPIYRISGAEYVFSAQLGVEVNKMKGYKGKPASIVASFGGFTKGYKTSFLGFREKNNFAFLAGINQQVTKRSRLSLKIGALYTYNSTFDVHTLPNYTEYNTHWYPYGELSYRLYAIPFGDRDFFSAKKAYTFLQQQNKETICRFFSAYFNPRISFGAGVTHPAFFGPTLGVKIWRLDVGLGVIGLGGEPYFSMNGDVDILKILKKHKHPSWITVGASVMGSYDIIFSFHAGLKKYYNHGSLSFKIGIGSISHYDDSPYPSEPKPNTRVPTLDISYNLHLFKFRK